MLVLAEKSLVPARQIHNHDDHRGQVQDLIFTYTADALVPACASKTINVFHGKIKLGRPKQTRLFSIPRRGRDNRVEIRRHTVKLDLLHPGSGGGGMIMLFASDHCIDKSIRLFRPRNDQVMPDEDGLIATPCRHNMTVFVAKTNFADPDGVSRVVSEAAFLGRTRKTVQSQPAVAIAHGQRIPQL